MRVNNKYPQSWCKRCLSKFTKTTRRSNRDWIDNYKKELSCEICGDSRHYVLVFHHRDKATKEFSIGNSIHYSLSRIKKELKKCQTLCANCHHELHYNDRKNNEV